MIYRTLGTLLSLFSLFILSTFLLACSTEADPKNIEKSVEKNTDENEFGIRFLRKSDSRRLIIFVHGLHGDGVDTWKNSRSNIGWPNMIVNDASFNDSDIAIYKYPTAIFEDNLSIDEVADNLRLRISGQKISNNYDEIVFVAHSMGGLVVRAYLLKNRDTVLVPMIYFYATPTNGSVLANLATIITNDRQAEGLKKLEDNLYLQSQVSSWLASKYPSETRSYCAYETKKTSGIMVVPMSSVQALCNKRLDPINENHIRIVKPAKMSHDSYVAFKVAYEETFQNLRIVGIGKEVVINDLNWQSKFSNGVLVADKLTIIGQDIRLPDNAIIIANDIVLQDSNISGSKLSIVTASIRGGIINVSGLDGQHGGELLIAAGRIIGTRIMARGGDGVNGSDGANGSSGTPGRSGQNGNCAGFGGWRAAQSGSDGTPGTDGTDGNDGGNGGNGGTVYILSLNDLPNTPDMSAGTGGQGGRGGHGGRGGAGGRGGNGCTGLGGSQSNRANGADGIDGRDGRNGFDGAVGSRGAIWYKQIQSLSEIANDVPNASEIPDYANDIVVNLKARARDN